MESSPPNRPWMRGACPMYGCMDGDGDSHLWIYMHKSRLSAFSIEAFFYFHPFQSPFFSTLYYLAPPQQVDFSPLTLSECPPTRTGTNRISMYITEYKYKYIPATAIIHRWVRIIHESRCQQAFSLYFGRILRGTCNLFGSQIRTSPYI